MDGDSWCISQIDFGVVRHLATELDVNQVTAEILARRGFTDAEAARAFLHPDHRLHSPYLLSGMAAARARIDRALQRGEPIAVHGDYDADGITATFVAVEVLQSLGADVRWRLPNRFTEGYGIVAATIEELAADGVRLLVTVDCGVNSVEEVRLAQKLGMDVIITDHHELAGELPPCIVVSPKLPGYPFSGLAGVGVAFKLAHALLQDQGEDRVELPLNLRPLVDVVAVGTVADLVPLQDENRTLVAMGLGRLRTSPRPGLAALMEVGGIVADQMTAGKVGYRLAPLLNAAGRLEDASLALELLAAADRETALPLALRLNELNRQRQEIEAAIFAAALEMLPEPLPPALVLSSPDWHEGVVGIVASRLAERVYRPTILLSEGEEVAKGSGRSIPGFDLLEAVRASSATLLAYGGHRAACGLRLPCAQIGAFREAFTTSAAARLSAGDLVRRTRVDAITGGDDLTLALADELELLAPHGVGNPAASLLLHGAEVSSPRLTRDRRHLRCTVRCEGASCAAVHFDFHGPEDVGAGRRFDIPLALTKNSYNGVVSAQVQVKALYPLAEPGHDLCSTSCTVACGDRLSGADLWQYLEQVELGSLAASDQAAARVEQARSEGRLLDRRGRPIVAGITSLVATGERVLVVVADVARRRPLLAHDVLSPQLGCEGLYLHGACVAARAGLAVPAAPDASTCAPGAVMTDCVSAALNPALVAAFAHVFFVDPPFSSTLLDAIVGAAGPSAWAHYGWGAGEVHFSEKVLAAGYDVDARLRQVWRVVSGRRGRLADGAAESELLGAGAFLAELPTLAAALSTLDETGLLAGEEGKNRVRPVESKVDLSTSRTYLAWHQLFHTKTYLKHCLTAPL